MIEVLRLALPGPDPRPRDRRHRTGGIRSARVAIGTFDGVHLGHRQVLRECDTVLTFDPHPIHVLKPGNAPSLLSDGRLKLRKLAALGIRRAVIVPFDVAWSRVSADDFVEDVILDGLDAGFVSVGEGFRFGAHGAGTTSTFGRYPTLRTRVVPTVTCGPAGEPISSTRIRRLVLEGRVEAAADLLGAPLSLPALVDEDGRLSVAAEFARPAPGLYLGHVDCHRCILRVREDLRVEVPGTPRTGTRVTVTFVEQAS
ncbi:FAD synthetase family protein [Pseudonocardia sp. N23]|uniref:FAD synthetase family protein n=1 Tax=Pseudonocardia sp. N23 TaxID=1987376 RepID=UPI000C0373F8|nr:FAD synthetase family protein [Pseudonocardia sp. N23]GAY07683.1 riboflavin kinase [Pseudonocardia sp. N23]